MNTQELNEKKAAFQSKLKEVYKQRKPYYSLRSEFIQTFPRNGILGLKKEEYVLGRHFIDATETFCYWLEKKLDRLGTISGSPAWQYGVYYGSYKKSKTRKYQFMQRWGSNLEDAFVALKTEISNLLYAGYSQDLNAIENNYIADKFKGKILSTYFPDRYLNIFSNDYLNDILIHFNLDSDDIIEKAPILKQAKLLDFKNHDTTMSKWTVDVFAVFLNEEMAANYYNNDLRNTELEDYALPNYPNLSSIEIDTVSFDIMLDSGIENDLDKEGTNNKKSTDYLKKARLLKNIGDRAEAIVMKYEEQYLQNNGKSKLAGKILQISKTDDYAGYDIKSFDLDGSPKYIEVKATKAPKGKANFYFTRNEKSKAEKLNNYHIYIVYSVKSKTPSIWDLGNIFDPLNKKIKMTPMNYYIEVN